MRTPFLLVLILLPLSASAASERGLGGEVTPEEKKATIQFIEGLRDRETGAFKNSADAKPSLRATNGAVKALRALGEEVTEIEKIQKFVLKCYDQKTGVFAELGGKPDVTTTSIGIIVACEVDIPHDKFPKAMEYVLENAKGFEEYRIGSAAVEAWGIEDLKLKNFMLEGEKEARTVDLKNPQDGLARDLAASLVSSLRLEKSIKGVFTRDACLQLVLQPGQCADGGWRKKGEKTSDIESTYSVMRAFKMLEAKPKDIAQLQKYIAAHRNKDGGYAIKPGDVSTMSGTYYSVIISKWLSEK